MKIKQLKLIAKESALTADATKAYVNFMRKRFPKEHDESYSSEWAERFAKGTDWLFADSKSRKILVKIGWRNKKGELRK